jgi:diaminopimelate epimerase
MELHFKKMHGLGNDFIVLDARETLIELNETQIKLLCDRHYGIGCDQLIILKPSGHADIFVEFYNSDGSESGACGNGTRCVADLTDAKTIETKAGILKCQRKGELIEIDMGIPKSFAADQNVPNDYDLPNAQLVDVGNPHCVFFLDDLETINPREIGPHIETNSLFPNRTNVEFVKVLDQSTVQQITWERGAGITNACGTGACAVAYSAYKTGLCGNTVTVQLANGALLIHIDETDRIFMAGPSASVFEGTIELP